MKILNQLCSIGVGKANEDLIYKGDGFVLVMDGATGLTSESKDWFNGYETEAEWFVNNFAKLFEREFKKLHADKALRSAIKKIKSLYFALSREREPIGWPSAAMTLVVEDEEHYNIYTTGDIKTIIYYDNGIIKPFYQDELMKIDETVFDLAEYLMEERKVTFLGAIELLEEMIKSNRKMLGSGYSALQFQHFGIFSREVVSKNSKILIMTDGVYTFFDESKETLRFLESTSPKEIEATIDRKIAEEDTFIKYPRFKIKDDLAFVIIK